MHSTMINAVTLPSSTVALLRVVVMLGAVQLSVRPQAVLYVLILVTTLNPLERTSARLLRTPALFNRQARPVHHAPTLAVLCGVTQTSVFKEEKLPIVSATLLLPAIVPPARPIYSPSLVPSLRVISTRGYLVTGIFQCTLALPKMQWRGMCKRSRSRSFLPPSQFVSKCWTLISLPIYGWTGCPFLLFTMEP